MVFCFVIAGVFLSAGFMALHLKSQMKTKFAVLGLCVASSFLFVIGGVSAVLNMSYLFSPPRDLYSPYSSVLLNEATNTYSLMASHKYDGNHCISITVPERRETGKTGGAKLFMDCKFYDNGRLVLTRSDEEGVPFWKGDSYGYQYCYYDKARVVSTTTVIRVDVILTGNVREFLRENKGAVLSVGKASDK